MTRNRARYRTSHPLAAMVALAFTVGGLAACGSSGETTEATTDVTTAADSDTTATDTTADDTTATDSAATADTTATADTAPAATTMITATVTGGQVDVESDRFQVALGSEVSIMVETDVAEPVHLHGYDIETDAAPGPRPGSTSRPTCPGCSRWSWKTRAPCCSRSK